MQFQTLTATPDGDEVRVEKLRGDTYLVAPTVLVREGVLNGGLLTYEEIEKSVPGWNGRPVTAPPAENESGHPRRNGEFVSANEAEFLESMQTGFLQNTEAREDLATPKGDENPRGLVGEAWINLGRTQDISDLAVEAARRMAKGERLEVSTGYFHGIEQTGGMFQGEEYEFEQFDLMPDHLALLPNERGACSWGDGCGAPRANTVDMETAVRVNRSLGERVLSANVDLYEGGANARTEPRTPEWSDLEPAEDGPAWSDVPLSFGVFVENYADENEDATQWTDLNADERRRIAARSLNGDPNADTFDEAVVLPVVNPETDALSENGLDAALSRAPQTDGINADETQRRIRTLLENQFDRDLETNTDEDPMTILQRIRSLVSAAENEDREVPRDTAGEQTDNNTNMKYEQLAEQTEFDLETLKDMSDEQISALAETVEGGSNGSCSCDGTGAQNTNDDGDDTDADGDGSEVAALREQVESLTETVETLAEEQNKDPQAEQARAFLSDLDEFDESTLDETPDEVVVNMARDRGAFGGREAPRGAGVNRLAQAGGSQVDPTSNGEDELDEYVSNAGALSQMGGE